MVLIASINYTNKMFSLKNFLPTNFEQLKIPLGETPGLARRHLTPLATLFFIINMSLTERHAMPLII